MHDLVADWAAATPDALAIAGQGEVLSYGELNRRANHFSSYLQVHGVGPDGLVGLCVERSAAFVVAALGILKAGAAYVPLDPTCPSDRLAFMMRDSNAPLVFTQQRLATRLPSGPWRVIVLDADGELPAGESHPPRSNPSPQHLAYVIYTSGSTGRPKGVMISHASLSNLVFWHQRAFDVTSADRASQLASLGFDAAVWEIWPYLAAGASVHIVAEDHRLAAERLRDWIVSERISVSFLPTALAEEAMALGWPPKTALRILLTGGDTLRRFPPRMLPFKVVNNYGPTECTVVSTSGAVLPNTGPGASPSIGQPITNARIHILDGALQEVPTGETGELHVGGAGVARGYLNQPDLSAERFIPDPFSSDVTARLYRTGDRARYLPDGQIAFLGRMDDQIKIRGYRIEPNEIVVVLNRHPEVHSSVVIARSDLREEKRLVAYIVPAAAAQPTVGALRDWLAASVPPYMLPDVFVRLGAFPLTAHGKIDPSALPAPTHANALRDEVYESPRTPVEGRLAAILASLVGLERLGINDNFFLLGGHSLLGTQAIAKVRDAFGVDLSLRILFTAPTVSGLSAEVERLLLERLDAMSDEDVRRSLDV